MHPTVERFAELLRTAGGTGEVRELADSARTALSQRPTLWAAAGHPHAVFSTTYDELLRLTGGQPAVVR